MGGHSSDPTFNAAGPTPCDIEAVKLVYCTAPTPTPTPTLPQCPQPTTTAYGSWCSWNAYTCQWVCFTSPVLLDIKGDGFSLTDAAGGVAFDLDGVGAAERLSWTEAASDDAWLALDRDGNGAIDSGRELFGDITPQPPSAEPNGFLALALYDDPGQGGNADGVIDERDSVFASLRLWRDVNHDGASQPEELHALPELGVASISLDYREAARRDRYGNLFRYRAAVSGAGGRTARRLAYDVFLVSGR